MRRNKYYTERVLTSEITLKDGKRDTILQWLYDTHLVEWYVTYLLHRKLSSHDVEDKIQEIYLMLAEITQEKWTELYNQGIPSVSAYAAGLIHRQIVSSSSKIYKTYNLYKTMEITQDETFWNDYGTEH